MRLSAFLPLSAILTLGLTSVFATEDHTLTVFQVLVTQGNEATVAPVTYVTWYGAEQETTLSALCWPAIIGSPHDDVASEDRNWASLLGLKSTLIKRDDAWRLTFDLTKLKPIPSRPEVAGSGDDVRATILEHIFAAASKNLLAVGVFDCELSVLGEGAYKDLATLDIPKVLNPVSATWGPWTYKDLRKTYPDGDLHHLAARSLTHIESLHTLFLILSSEKQSAEGKTAMSDFLKEVLARVGDDKFAQILKDSESLVQTRIAEAVIAGDARAIEPFPKTAAFLKK
jgi:hypothetical protein